MLARTLHITNTKYCTDIRNSRKISTFTNTKEWEVQCHQWALVQSQKTCSQSHETLFLTVHRYQLTPCVRVLFFSLSQSVSLNDDVDDEPLMTILLLLLLLLKQGNVKVFFDLKMSNDRLVSPRFCSSKYSCALCLSSLFIYLRCLFIFAYACTEFESALPKLSKKCE